MKRYFLGLAANYTPEQRWRHTFAVGRERDRTELAKYLGRKYGGEAILCKNGRSALALALKAYFEPGDAVIVNGFTCYAVYEAVKAAGLKPVWADVDIDCLNYSTDTLESIYRTGPAAASSPTSLAPLDSAGVPQAASPVRTEPAGIIIQNTLGNPVDIAKIEKFAKKHGLIIIEDLAHSAGVKYPDGREAGTMGAATVWSFGKDKSIDTVSGGAVVLREPISREVKAPSKPPRFADSARARFYPLLGAMCRGLSCVHLGGALMQCLLKLHLVERSADNRLDLERKINKFQAKLALEQLRKLKKSGEPPIRNFCLVQDRDKVLEELKQAGYYFGGFWYERPVSPERYYKRVHFPERECPNAVYVSEHILNLPTYYAKQELAKARRIIEANREGGRDE